MEFVNAWLLLRLTRLVASRRAVDYDELLSLFGESAFSLVKLAEELGLIKWARVDAGRTKAVYTLGPAGRRLIGETERGCGVSARVNYGVLYVEICGAVYRAEPTPSYLLSMAEKLYKLAGYNDMREMYKALRSAVERALRSAPGLEKYFLRTQY